MGDVTRDLRVAILMGGRSAEREVSLNTGRQVAEALESIGYGTVCIDSLSPDFIADLREAGPGAVFVCLHGRYGEDGTVQGMLELLDLAYVGSGVLASALAMDKVMSKHFFAQAGIPSPAYVHFRRQEPLDTHAVTKALGPKTVVKPVNEGSAIGVTISHEPDNLSSAVDEALRFDDNVLIEEFVAGTEVTVGVLGNEELLPLPTLEIVPEHEFYDYESKYVPGMSRHIIPARVSEEVRLECQRLALQAHRVFGCRGMSRSDMIVDTEGRAQMLEVNTIPGMTRTSLLPDAARAAGIEFPQLCARLIELALEKR